MGCASSMGGHLQGCHSNAPVAPKAMRRTGFRVRMEAPVDKTQRYPGHNCPVVGSGVLQCLH